MLLLKVFFACLVLWSTSECASKKGKSVKPVDLAHSCMQVKNGKQNSTQSPVVLLHGLAMSKENWMGVYQVIALKTSRRVCIADLRNHGDSPWSDESNVDDMAADVVQLIKTLKANKVVLIGHSLGGKIAMHVALNYPDKIEKLIVEDMRPNGIRILALLQVNVFMNLLRTSLTAIPKGADEATAKKAVAEYLNKRLKRMKAPFEIDENGAEYLPINCTKGKCQWKANMELLKKVQKRPLKYLTRSSGLYKGPTLFIYGTASPFKVKLNERSIKKLFPNAKLVGVQGAGHVIHGFYQEFLDESIKFINASS